MEVLSKMKEPYEAATKGKWKEVQNYYELRNELALASLTSNGESALHIAVHDENTDLLDFLLQILKPLDVEEFSPFQKSNDYGQTALHVAAASGNRKAAKLLLRYDENLLSLKNNEGETALFSAAAFGRTNMVKFLASKIKDRGPHFKRNDHTSILHIAILGGYFETAVELLKLNCGNPDFGDKKGVTGFQLLASMPSAFRSGYPMGKLKALLYYCLPKMDYAGHDKEEIDSGPQLKLGKTEDLEKGRVTRHPQNCSQAADSHSGSPGIESVWKDKQKQNKALELAKILAKTDLSWQQSDKNNGDDAEKKDDKSRQPTTASQSNSVLETISITRDDRDLGDDAEKADEPPQPPAASQTSSLPGTPLFEAAKNGISEIVDAILKVYPQAIEHVDRNNENIFHVVAKHRRTKILDLLQSPAAVVPILRLKGKINVQGDSILHKAAYLGASSSRFRPGEALQMQSEIQWFKRVQKIVPAYFINHRNQDKKTAHELFTEEHKKLVKDGKEWLMRTTQASSLVAVLIATVAFTCAYTVPGGSNKSGHPLLQKTSPFSVFATSDALSLCFSLTSVVVFLSIMTSKMHEQDFRRSLPLKLVFGLTTLFFAVTAMMVAFAATLVLMIRQRLHWAAIPIYTIACCPVTIFLILQLRLYLNIAWFTVKDLFA